MSDLWSDVIKKIDVVPRTTEFGYEPTEIALSSKSIWQEAVSKIDTFKDIARQSKPTFADAITLSSYGLGLWWTMGGPTWAGMASIVGDELDGRVARAMNTQSERGSALDWGADVTLTPLALMRFGRAINQNHPEISLLAAPPLLFMQASLRSQNYRPDIGSVRAVVMLGTMAVESWKGR